MASNKLRLKVITPERIKYDEDADMVIMRCTTGDMGILPRHEPCSAILGDGVLRIITGDDELRMAVFGGIAQVRDDVVTILANDAQWPDEIDRAHVEAEHERIKSDAEIERDEILIRRMLVQIEVSSYPLMSKTRRVND